MKGFLGLTPAKRTKVLRFDGPNGPRVVVAAGAAVYRGPLRGDEFYSQRYGLRRSHKRRADSR